MRWSLIIMMSVAGCSNPELEAENQSLKDEVSKLTADNKKCGRFISWFYISFKTRFI